MSKVEQVEIFAHRGASGRFPENTMRAFAEAHQVGADGIELDVQLTKDKKPVVIHDDTVERTTDGKGAVNSLILDEIKSLDAGAWFSEEFKGEKIPSLTEVLEWIKETDLKLNIELKDFLDPDAAHEIVLKMIEEHSLEERVIISSFNHVDIHRIGRLNQRIERAILVYENLYKPFDYASAVGVNSVHCYWPVVTPELLISAQTEGMTVRTFTVNKPEAIERLIKLGCSGIMTDWPELAQEIKERELKK